MAGESKQIYQLTSGTFNGSSLVPFEVPNTDTSTSAERPYITRKTTGDEVSEFVAKTQEFETDLETDSKTIIGAINELKEGGGGNANYVELTQAEYDELTEEEKHNGKMYFITDGGSDGESIGFVEEAIPDIPDREIPYYPSGEYSDLNTTNKHIVGAINEVNTAIRVNKSDFFASGMATDFDVFKVGKLIIVNRLSFTGVTCSQYASLATIKDEYKPNTNSLRLIATYPSGLNIMQITNNGFISETALNNQNVLLNSFAYIAR